MYNLLVTIFSLALEFWDIPPSLLCALCTKGGEKILHYGASCQVSHQLLETWTDNPGEHN